jgi:hypothetical protein
MRVAVYTCVTGGYDTIKVPNQADPRIDYHLFTDTSGHFAAPWQPHLLELRHLNAVEQNRFVKMHPHKLPELGGYDITVYVDGSIRIVGDVFELIERCWSDGGYLHIYEHPFRRCVYDEAHECALIGHASISALARQMRRYRSAGFPERAGLFEANVLVRRPSPVLERAMEIWWDEYRAGVRRDQLSFTYAAWRSGLTIASLGSSDPRYGHRYFELLPHKAVRQPMPTLLRGWINRAAIRMAPQLARF